MRRNGGAEARRGLEWGLLAGAAEGAETYGVQKSEEKRRKEKRTA